MKKMVFLEVIIVLYIILFLYTGISKLIDYSLFKEQIATSPLLASVSRPIAIGLPWIEFLVVGQLIIPRWRLKGLYSALLLMSLFTIYIIGILSFNKELPCSCGGVISALSWSQHIFFNASFIMMALIGIKIERQSKKAGKQDLLLVRTTNF